MQSHLEAQTVECKNCGNHFTGKYCNQCGEKVYDAHARSFKHLFEEAFHFLTHFEGTFFNSLKAMALRPGKLSLDFCSGIRKKYFKPLSFFLMLVIIYLLFPVFEGLNMKLHFHKAQMLYGNYAASESEKVREEKNYTEEQLEEAFDHKGEKTSKFMLFTILPFMALVSYALGFRKRKYYFDHFIFSTEVVSFFILWGFLVLPFILLIAHWVHLPPVTEDLVLILVFLISGFYTSTGARRFFGFRRWYSILYGVVFCVLLGLFLEFVYKFLLFFVAIHLL
jgi:hypothetical protein